MKQIYLWMLLLVSATAFAQQPIITAIVDGSCSGGTPKAFEIYAQGTVDFTQYSIERYNNGSAMEWQRTTNLGALGTVTDDFVYILNSSDNTLFQDNFPAIPTNRIFNSNVAGNNGDDSVRIVLDSDSSVVDQFGAEVDGSGEPWEYLDSYATRLDGTGPDAGFVLGNWSFNPTNLLDNEGNCDGNSPNSALINIVPLGSYTTTANTSPTINVSGPVTGLNYFETQGPSSEGSITVSGRNLTADIVITVPSTDFEISETSGGTFSQSITLQQQGGDVAAATLFVRLAAGLQAANYTEDISFVSGGATTQTVTVAGEVSPNDPDVFITGGADGMNYNEGSGPSPEDSFAVSGRFLTDQNVVVTVSAPFEISTTTAGTFGQTVNLTVDQATGEVDFADVFIRLAAGQPIGQYNETVTATANGVSDTVVVTGEVLPAASCPNVGDLVITEFLANPGATGDADGEYFEVYNTTGSAIDMASFDILDDGSDSFTVASSVVVPANGYVVFARNADSNTNGGIPAVDYEYGTGMFLSNSGDEIVLSCNGVEIDRINYDGSWPGGNGVSAELSTTALNAIDNDNAANWGDASNTYGTGDLGTPGAANDYTLSNGSLDNVSFKLYPNPVSGNMVNIETANNDSVNVSVYSLLGKQVLNVKNVSRTFNVSALDTGVYLVTIIQGENSQTRKLIVK